MYLQPGTIARSLISTAIDRVDTEATTITAILDAIPGAWDWTQEGLADVKAGRAVPLDQLSLPGRFRLGVEELPLPREPVRVAAQRPVGAHHAVARDNDRDRVLGAGSAHGPRRPRRPDGRGDLPVRASLAGRYAAQRLPNAPPESRGVDV